MSAATCVPRQAARPLFGPRRLDRHHADAGRATVAFGSPGACRPFSRDLPAALFGQGMMTEVALTAIGRWFAANRGALSRSRRWATGSARVSIPSSSSSSPPDRLRDTWLVCTGVILLIAAGDPRSSASSEPAQATTRRRRSRRSATGRARRSCAIRILRDLRRRAGARLHRHDHLLPPGSLAELRGWSLGTFGPRSC